MRVLISMKPCVMVVNEIEANHNFIEALFYYGAHSNCMVDCMSYDDQYINIQNIVAAEGEEIRTTRHACEG